MRGAIALSLKHLEQLGVLLPREEWGRYDLASTVNSRWLAVVAILGVAALVLMYIGNGKTLTFVGIGLFLLFMGLITRVSLQAIEAQSARFQRQREEGSGDVEEPLVGDTATPSSPAPAGSPKSQEE